MEIEKKQCWSFGTKYRKWKSYGFQMYQNIICIEYNCTKMYEDNDRPLYKTYSTVDQSTKNLISNIKHLNLINIICKFLAFWIFRNETSYKLFILYLFEK